MLNMKKVIILLLLALLLISPVAAQEEKICAYYFYGESCSYCTKIKPTLDAIELAHPELELYHLAVDEPKNARLLSQFYAKFGIETGGTPTLVMDDKIFVGARTIANEFENQLAVHTNGLACPITEGHTQTITLLAIFGAAAVDAINPCALAVLILLLITIAGAAAEEHKKKKVLKAGLAFTLAVYLSYLLMGFGLFSIIQSAGITNIIKKIVGVLALLVGILNIKDFVRLGAGGFVMEVPISWRPKMKSLIKGVTSVLGAFLVGLVVSLFLLPCTSGPYIVVLGMLANSTTFWSAVPLLLIYNLIFVSPMVIIVALVYFGAKPIDIEHIRKPRTKEASAPITRTQIRIAGLPCAVIMT